MSQKQDSDAKKVFEMVQNLKSRYGMKEPEPTPDEEADDLDPIESETSAVSPESERVEKETLPAEEPETPLSDLHEEPKQDFQASIVDDAEEPEQQPDETESESPVEEPEPAIDASMTAEIAEESPVLPDEESNATEELPEELIYEEPKIDDIEDEEEQEEKTETEESDGLENQIAIDVPAPAEPTPAEEESDEGETAPEEAPAAPSQPALQTSFHQTQAPMEARKPAAEEFRPVRRAPVETLQKPIAAEQLTLVNPPVMKVESMAKSEEAPSIESLERSGPNLSKLSDDERRQRSGLSDEDISMMLEFGYEDDLNRVLGYRTVRKQKYNSGKSDSGHMDLRPFAYSGKEYDGSTEGRTEILNAYRKDKIFLLLRLILTGLCALFLLVFDLMARVQGEAGTTFIPKLYGILVLAVTAAISHRTLAGAYRSLVFFSPTPHSIPALLLPIALACDLLSIFAVGGITFPVVNFMTALVFLLSAAGDFFRYSTEKHAFLVLSAASKKIAPESYIRRKKKLQRGDEIMSLIDDSPDHAEYRVRPVGRLTGFFRRCGNLSDTTGWFSVLLPLALGLSTLGALVIWAFRGVSSAITAFVNLFFFSAPISSIFAFFYPAGLASRNLSRKRSAIIGEESIGELTQEKVLLFSDSRAFKAGKCIQTPLRKDSDFSEDLRLSGILFRKLGGVLAEIATPLFPEGPDPAVSILRIRENGVEALVDNRYHLLAGSREFLLRYGIRFPLRTEEPNHYSSETASLFVAIDDVLKLRYDVEYHRLNDFDALLHRFGESQTSVGIYTYDPNLTEAFLRNLYHDETLPTLVKPGAFDEESEVYVTDAPAVTLGEDESLAEPVEIAATVKRARKIGFRVQIAVSSVGSLFATILTLMGQSSVLGLGTLIAFHIASLILTWGITTSQFNQPHS